MARTAFTTPIAWITAGVYKMWNVAVIMITTPVEWLISLTTWLLTYVQYPFIWIFAALSQDRVSIPIPNNVDVKIAKTLVLSEGNNYNRELDIELLSSQVLQSVAFKKLQADLKPDFTVPESHTSLLLHVTEELKEMRANLESLKEDSDNKPADSKQYIFHALQREIKNLERRIRLLQLHQSAGKQCCDNMEGQVAAIVAGLFSGGDGTMPDDAANLIKTKLSVLNNLEARLSKVTADVEESQKRALEGLKMQVQASEVKPTFDLNSLSDERVRAIVREVLAVYDADKTNMVDYALETSGGTILSTRCTENYDNKHGVTYYWGLSWFSKEYRPNNPRTIIQPSVNPGECWAFKGATGFVVIELSTLIHVTSVSMEHIPRSLAPYGKIESAPRDFSVWGLKELMDPEPVLLGKFRFEDNEQPLQTFQVNAEHSGLQRIELRIESNHGHLDYTCVYRFRIHGIPAIS